MIEVYQEYIDRFLCCDMMTHYVFRTNWSSDAFHIYCVLYAGSCAQRTQRIEKSENFELIQLDLMRYWIKMFVLRVFYKKRVKVWQSSALPAPFHSLTKKAYISIYIL